ncbi:ABC transporter substrate-binding protein [Micromonospora sp. NPDC049559]|uniref:ABC transporter substrate-binding protein n=1 Tax=Micromonospora sp. NPDC049559 TaxID=3155923 RepID=UPI003441987B
MIGRARVLAAGLLATVLLGASACSSSDDKSGSDANGKALEKVTYLTTFGNAGRDAFAWVAKEKGYFKEAGLDVDIQLGKATGENVKLVAGGSAQYSNLDMIGAWILQATTPEYKDAFRTVAAVHQQSLVAIFVKDGGNITSPRDLAGKKIGAAANSVNQLLFPAYAQLVGIDPKSVTWVNVQTTDIPATLAAGRADAVSTFLISRTGIEKAAGKTIVLPYNNYLSDLFGNGIVASTKTIKENPDQVKRMRDALMKGLQYTIEHPDEAVDILHKAQPSSNPAAAKGEIDAMSPYVRPANNAPIGSMDQQRVAKALAILQGSGLFKGENLTPDQVVNFDLTPKA